MLRGVSMERQHSSLVLPAPSETTDSGSAAVLPTVRGAVPLRTKSSQLLAAAVSFFSTLCGFLLIFPLNVCPLSILPLVRHFPTCFGTITGGF